MQHINLPEVTELALVGDAHQNTQWMKKVIKSILKDKPEALIIQLGDFGLGVRHSGAAYLRKVNKSLKGNDMFVVLGNHDDYDKLAKASPHPVYPGGLVLQEAPNIVFLNRGARIRIGDKTILTVSGANSINKDFLPKETENIAGISYVKSWWEQEQISDNDVFFACYPGPADILLSHDSPMAGIPMDEEDFLKAREYWGDEACDYANASALQLDRIYHEVKPKLVAHGHHHKRKSTLVRNEDFITHFESLDKEHDELGVIIVNMETLNVSPYKVQQ